MPKNTRVHRCVDKLKRKGGSGNPYAICQAATGQSFSTGKPLHATAEMRQAKKNRKHWDK